MRLFVGAMVVIVCAALLSSRALAEAADSSASPRLKLDFDPAWQFIKQDIPAAKNPSFDDSKWATVSCPHTYNDVDTFDDWSLAGHRGEQNQFGGRTWYRKTFTAPEAWRSKNIYIEFEGARQVAEVYLNGELLGVSKTGFIPFGFDLTPHLKIGQANVLAVMCDNRFMKDPPENSAGRGGEKRQQRSQRRSARQRGPGEFVRQGEREYSGRHRRNPGRPDSLEQSALASSARRTLSQRLSLRGRSAARFAAAV